MKNVFKIVLILGLFISSANAISNNSNEFIGNESVITLSSLSLFLVVMFIIAIYEKLFQRKHV